MDNNHNQQVEELETALTEANETEANDQAAEETTPEVAPIVTGRVADCVKLNVRRAPSVKATVVCVIDRDAEVIIDEGKSNAEWYSVCTTAGVNGFCMKKYITISQ